MPEVIAGPEIPETATGAVRPPSRTALVFARRRRTPGNDQPGHGRPRRTAAEIAARVAGGVLIAGAAAAVVGCSPATEHPITPAHAAVASEHPAETLTPLVQQALPNVHGKTFTSATVTFPPGARAVPHRHGGAFVYAYVLEGAVRSRLDGGPTRIYHQGENWIEQPGAHHVATENVSHTEPAKLLVVFVSNTGEPLKIDDPHR